MTKSNSQVLKEESRQKISKMVGRWFHEPVIAVEDEIIELLESSLTHQKSEMIKGVEGMKRKANPNYATNAVPFNQALDDVTEQLRK